MSADQEPRNTINLVHQSTQSPPIVHHLLNINWNHMPTNIEYLTSAENQCIHISNNFSSVTTEVLNSSDNSIQD